MQCSVQILQMLYYDELITNGSYNGREVVHDSYNCREADNYFFSEKCWILVLPNGGTSLKQIKKGCTLMPLLVHRK